MFKVGDAVVYPPYGAGYVSRIEKKCFLNREETYHVFELLHEDLSIFVPSHQILDKNIRLAMNLKTMRNNVYRHGPLTHELKTNSPNRTNMLYEKILLTGNIVTTLSVMTAFLQKKRRQGLSQTDREIYRKYHETLVSEVIVTERVGTKKEAEALLDQFLKEIVVQ